MERVNIYDEEDQTNYTACIERNNTGWNGWIEKYPEVKATAKTKKSLLETLEHALYVKFELDWENWDKEIEADSKAGCLDWMLSKNPKQNSITLDEFLAKSEEINGS